MKQIAVNIFLLFLILVTWGMTVLHLGVMTTEGLHISKNPPQDLAGAKWIPKEDAGLNHLILFGDPFTRGYAAGKYTVKLMYDQEKTLIDEFYQIFPNPVFRNAFILGLLRWFWGIQDYFDDFMLEESYGVSLWASDQFNFLLDPFSRQIAYHGLHEVGQMMVDQGGANLGCTVFALPHQGSWVIGRNFDFEGGRVFDEEKIIKWVFPDQGYAFVSIIWAGMVGAVTGVNEHGVYISINAAGSDDFARYGTPSTLVLLKALQFSKTAKEAVEIIESAKMFITDIFVVADVGSPHIYRVEKSPDRVETIEESDPTVIANHLIGPTWASDETNDFRKRELTTLARERRGKLLLANVEKGQPFETLSSQQMVEQVLRLLRDKSDLKGNPFNLGNRQAIDALIATHSVIYDGPEMILYVSQGPAVSGPFIGYDLRKSFAEKMPVQAGGLARDPFVSDQQFNDVKLSLKMIAAAEKKIKAGECETGLNLLQNAGKLFNNHSNFYRVYGDYEECVQDDQKARELWKKALSLKPAYLKSKNYLSEKLSSVP